MSNQNGLKPGMTDAEHQKWLQGWSDFMIKMWRERMMQFAPPVYRTGALASSSPPSSTTSLSMASMWHVAWAMATAVAMVATSSSSRTGRPIPTTVSLATGSPRSISTLYIDLMSLRQASTAQPTMVLSPRSFISSLAAVPTLSTARSRSCSLYFQSSSHISIFAL